MKKLNQGPCGRMGRIGPSDRHRKSLSADLLLSCPADERDQLAGGEAALSLVMPVDFTPPSCRPGSFPPPEVVGDVHIEDPKAARTPAHPQERASVRPRMEKGTSGYFTGDPEEFR